MLEGQDIHKEKTTASTMTQTSLETRDVCVEAKPSSITVQDLVQGHQQIDVNRSSSFILSPNGRVVKTPSKTPIKTPIKRSLSESAVPESLQTTPCKRLWSASHQQMYDVASPLKRQRHEENFHRYLCPF